MHSPIEKQLEEILHLQRDLFLKAPWESKDFYMSWLAQSFHFVKHSTRLLGAVIHHSKLGENKFLVRTAKHILEEVGHENLAARDLEKLGSSIGNYRESVFTKLFYRNQFYGIEKFGSHYMMGYILYLEAIASRFGDPIGEKIQNNHAQGMTFLQLHANEDKGHVELALQQLKEFNEQEQKEIGESLQMSAEIYSEILSEIRMQLDQMDKSGSGIVFPTNRGSKVKEEVTKKVG